VKGESAIRVLVGPLHGYFPCVTRLASPPGIALAPLNTVLAYSFDIKFLTDIAHPLAVFTQRRAGALAYARGGEQVVLLPRCQVRAEIAQVRRWSYDLRTPLQDLRLLGAPVPMNDDRHRIQVPPLLASRADEVIE
jgi:hypothetical protein